MPLISALSPPTVLALIEFLQLINQFRKAWMLQLILAGIVESYLWRVETVVIVIAFIYEFNWNKKIFISYRLVYFLNYLFINLNDMIYIV